MTIRSASVGFALLGFLLVLAAPVLAADPAAYLADMPSSQTIIAKTQGTDAFDTAARQFPTFDRLFELTVALIGDRYVAGQMTPAEKTLRDDYLGNRDRVLRELKASLPEDQRPYLPNTRFAAWYQLVDNYRSDPAFNAQFLNFFPAAFRQAHAPILATLEANGRLRSLPPPTSGAPAAGTGVSSSAGGSGPLVIPALIVLAVIFPILLKRARLELDSKDAFTMYLGGGTYRLNHVTGTVEGASKLGTTNVYGGGGYDQGITISSSTTIKDQFFIRQADGQVESIQLSNWDFPVADGHVTSAVWAIREGESAGPYLIMRNHTTRDTKSTSSLLNDRIQRMGAGKTRALELAFVAGLAVVAASVVGSLPVAIAAAFGGVVIGSVVWHFVIKARFLSRWRRNGVPRVVAALDGLAVTPTASAMATHP